jgi:uncharacterized glyoxalase superfamily protein PhnB
LLDGLLYRRDHGGGVGVVGLDDQNPAAAAAGATVIAEPTRTPWASLNARLEAPAGLQLTLFTDDPRADDPA